MKMLKRILAAVAASAVSLCIFTACGSDPKYDTSVFIKTASARTGYELKESKSLDNALQVWTHSALTQSIPRMTIRAMNRSPTIPSRRLWATQMQPNINISPLGSYAETSEPLHGAVGLPLQPIPSTAPPSGISIRNTKT